MVRTIRMVLALVTLSVALSACSLLTEPSRPLEEFQWIAVENQSEIQEGIDAAGFFGDISFVGQFKTPTLCFNVEPSFEQSGSTLTLRIDAKSTNAPNCNATPGGFRYQGVLRHLDRGAYTLRVLHAVQGAPVQEYTAAITI